MIDWSDVRSEETFLKIMLKLLDASIRPMPIWLICNTSLVCLDERGENTSTVSWRRFRSRWFPRSTLCLLFLNLRLKLS